MKKRKVQRKEQKEHDKKRRDVSSGIGDREKFHLQAAATNRQITVAENKNMIEFLQMAQGASIWDQSELKGMFQTA